MIKICEIGTFSQKVPDRKDRRSFHGPPTEEKAFMVHRYSDRYVGSLEKAKWFVFVSRHLAIGGCVYPMLLLFPTTRLFLEPPRDQICDSRTRLSANIFPIYFSRSLRDTA
jgi:hypothetical protein